MSSVILGTAGHIDHGKSALVRALTGVDPDRLKEEKERGITIELGFAELAPEGRPHFGVVDVPGHEAFVRAMVAGAGGMDVVLLVVAADEGVMPQTREHLAIVELLEVPELIVALTKCDAVEAEWLELVEADVADTLSSTRYAGAPMVRTSALAKTGLDTLIDALSEVATRMHSDAGADLTRLPLDRVFTIQGTGTVVTGTLWGGSVSAGDRVRILPDDLTARVRTVQVHGRRVATAEARDRTAVALAGEGADRGIVSRGATLVTDSAWAPSWMVTARVRLLEEPGWSLAHNQRVHVHLGTAEVLARCALLETSKLAPGEGGWIQLRLEEPLVARARDRFIIRAYSPVTTLGGGVVAEVQPPKRRGLDEDVRGCLARLLDGGAEDAIAAHLEIVGWAGADLDALCIHTGLTSAEVAAALPGLGASGTLFVGRRAFSSSVREEASRRIVDRADREHERDTLSEIVPLPPLRAALPSWAPPEAAQGVIDALLSEGRLESQEGGVRRPGHRAQLTGDQAAASRALERVFAESGLAAPFIDELPDELRTRPDVRSLIRRLESLGVVRQVADGLYIDSAALERAREQVREQLGGRRHLGPADFREALPVTRKHLIPLLNYLDGEGTTIRGEMGREVPPIE